MLYQLYTVQVVSWSKLLLHISTFTVVTPKKNVYKKSDTFSTCHNNCVATKKKIVIYVKFYRIWGKLVVQNLVGNKTSTIFQLFMWETFQGVTFIYLRFPTNKCCTCPVHFSHKLGKIFINVSFNLKIFILLHKEKMKALKTESLSS